MLRSCYSFFHYAYKTLFFVGITLLATLFSFVPKGLCKDWHFKLYRYWSIAFFRIFRIKEHIHKQHQKLLPQQFILISNHPSGIDVIWLPGKFKAVPLSKDDIKHWPIVGNITRAAGIIFVNREETQSRSNSLKACMQEIEQGKSLLIFPEGGCLGKALHHFHSGAFDIAYKTKVPIVPVYLHYEEEDTYEWGHIDALPYIKRLLFKAKNRNGHLYIFDAINPQDFADAAALKNYTFKFYKNLEQQYGPK